MKRRHHGRPMPTRLTVAALLRALAPAADQARRPSLRLEHSTPPRGTPKEAKQ